MGEDDSDARDVNKFGLLKLVSGIQRMGRILLREDEVSKQNGRSGNSCGAGGAGGLHGEPVLESLETLEKLASVGGAVEEERAGDGEDASCVLAADGQLDLLHFAAIR